MFGLLFLEFTHTETAIMNGVHAVLRVGLTKLNWGLRQFLR